MPDATATPAVPGTPEHDAAMVAKVDAAHAAVAGTAPVASQPEPATRPEHIPEKFWDAATGQVNVEAMAKSYSELERAKAPTPTPAAPTEGAPVVDGKPNMAALSQEFATTGALSEASYGALAAAGVDKGMVDAYIEGQRALAASRDAKGFEMAGGQEAFTSMATWAAANMPAAEVAALNASLIGSEAQMALAIAGLKSKYEAANGREPTLVKGNAAADQGDAPFASKGEMTAAMRDPRYKSDAAYRASVERRTAAMDW